MQEHLLEKRIGQHINNTLAPDDLKELARVQHACRIENSSENACPDIAVSTNNLCGDCRLRFQEMFGREPRCVTLPPHFRFRLLTMNAEENVIQKNVRPA